MITFPKEEKKQVIAEFDSLLKTKVQVAVDLSTPRVPIYCIYKQFLTCDAKQSSEPHSQLRPLPETQGSSQIVSQACCMRTIR